MTVELPEPFMNVGLLPTLRQDKLLSIINCSNNSPHLSVDGQFHTVLCELESVPIRIS